MRSKEGGWGSSHGAFVPSQHTPTAKWKNGAGNHYLTYVCTSSYTYTGSWYQPCLLAYSKHSGRNCVAHMTTGTCMINDNTTIALYHFSASEHARESNDQRSQRSGQVLQEDEGGTECKDLSSEKTLVRAVLAWRCAAFHLVRRLRLSQPPAGVHGHWHVHAQSICTGKFWRQLPILQCMLHPHKAIRLRRGQRCQIRQLEGHRAHLHTSQLRWHPSTTPQNSVCKHSSPEACSSDTASLCMAARGARDAVGLAKSTFVAQCRSSSAGPA